MLIWMLRAVFVLLMGVVAFSAISSDSKVGTTPAEIEQYQELSKYRYSFMLGSLLLAGVLVVVDWAVPRKSLAALSGTFMGVIVGILFAYVVGLVVDHLLLEVFWQAKVSELSVVVRTMLGAVKLMLGIIGCYLAISFILQTKDDFRFVIPYVEFSRQSRGRRPLILDTSVIIDGRIADICETRIIDAPIIIPRFVLQELQTIADSSDKLKRNRGRRGLDMLNKLQTNDRLEIKISDARLPSVEEEGDVDQKLVALAKKIDGRIVTNDYNLNKIAQIRGVDVININDLANALKPVLMPGETVQVKILRQGEEPGQGVGYLEDGTMIVAENAGDRMNEEIALTVTSVLQTSAGRMIFGRPEGMAPPPRRPHHGRR